MKLVLIARRQRSLDVEVYSAQERRVRFESIPVVTKELRFEKYSKYGLECQALLWEPPLCRIVDSHIVSKKCKHF